MTSYAYFIRGQKHANLALTSIASVKKADPKCRVIVATDEEGLEVPGAEMVRFECGGPMMVANIEAQLAVMWRVRTPIVFLDTDVIFLKPFPEQWEYGITVTWRNTGGGVLDESKGTIADIMPYNYGVIGINPGPRVFEAMIWMRERVRKMAPGLQRWYGNQIALLGLVGARPEAGETKEMRAIPWDLTDPGPSVFVKKIPGAIWNHTPSSPEEDITERGALHFKGHTRPWMKSYAEQFQLPWVEAA